jgi:hypothetical protein
MSAFDIWAIVVLTVLILVFMGPGMWSSSHESLGARVWRKLKGRRKGQAPGSPPDEPR